MHISEKQLKKLNDRLGSELGWVGSEPRYRWAFSEDLTYLARVVNHDGTPKYDFIPDQKTGLVLPQPIFELRRMCPHLDRQWVLMAWQDNTQSTGDILFQFGRAYYAFTDVALPAGLIPDEMWTWQVIDACREARKKRAVDIERELDESRLKCEATRKNNLIDQIREDCPTYDHVIGTKDGVSYPTVAA